MTRRAALSSRTSSSRETRRARRWLVLEPSVVVRERCRDADLERRRTSYKGGMMDVGEDVLESRSMGRGALEEHQWALSRGGAREDDTFVGRRRDQHATSSKWRTRMPRVRLQSSTININSHVACACWLPAPTRTKRVEHFTATSPTLSTSCWDFFYREMDDLKGPETSRVLAGTSA